MVNRKILTSLGLTSAWFDWGLLTTDQAEELLAEYQTSDDKRSEHYRWRAFDRFMNDNLEFDPIIIHRIYDLAKKGTG